MVVLVQNRERAGIGKGMGPSIAMFMLPGVIASIIIKLAFDPAPVCLVVDPVHPTPAESDCLDDLNAYVLLLRPIFVLSLFRSRDICPGAGGTYKCHRSPGRRPWQ